jgi:hypothetical protein
MKSQVKPHLEGPLDLEALGDFKTDSKGRGFIIERRKQRLLFDVEKPKEIKSELGN